ncbi:MAG TPA: hypothetical protein PKH94_04580, partial [Bacteroidales bacterium]|nr:hypothetical protein [Bacteroidales bacterium]
DEYVRRHDLICQIYTGMFISEMREAVMYKIESEDLEEKIRQSNELFAGLVNRYIDCEDISSRVVPEYILHDNPVADFNRERIYPCQEPIREAWPDEILRKELAEFPDYPEDDME